MPQSRCEKDDTFPWIFVVLLHEKFELGLGEFVGVGSGGGGGDLLEVLDEIVDGVGVGHGEIIFLLGKK